mgnify:CR=1 FL=1
MEQNKKILVSEWIKRAEDDELNALSILKHKDGTSAFVCFISHQIAEKFLKALLLFYSGDTQKIHSLAKLASLIKPFSSNGKIIEDDLKLLDSYYISARYPADIPLESFTWELAEEAYKSAVKIKNFVIEKINEKQKGIFPPQRDHARGVTTLTGIIIIIVVAVILFGGVFTYQYFFVKNNQNNETAILNTYTNDQYGFEIKYQDSFKGSVSADSKKAGVLFYGENTEQLKLEGYFVNKFDPKNLGSSINGGIFEKSEILIDGVKSYKTNSVICYMGCGSSYSVVIPYKNGAIIIGISRGDGSKTDPSLVKITDKEKANFDEIISTFKFTTLNETTDFKTYTNDNLGIAFQYLKQWGEPKTTLLSTKTQISFKNNSNVILTEGVYYNQILGRNMTFNEIQNSFDKIFPAGNLIKQENITISDKKGIKFIYSGSNDSGLYNVSIFIPVDENNTILEISFSYKSSDNTISDFNKFLSTIKFTK